MTSSGRVADCKQVNIGLTRTPGQLLLLCMSRLKSTMIFSSNSTIILKYAHSKSRQLVSKLCLLYSRWLLSSSYSCIFFLSNLSYDIQTALNQTVRILACSMYWAWAQFLILEQTVHFLLLCPTGCNVLAQWGKGEICVLNLFLIQRGKPPIILLQ